ncbi:hypothetical protein GCM10023144_44400 [Pigmentiphaga soli]|uniref:histidine kinase n=1 Tax=Pigmentiphaga soli TaxID=1007095 RepID=A0ABP8HPV5_9BURK
MLGALLDTLPAAAWVTDLSGRYRYVTAAYAKMVGRGIEQCIGHTAHEILPPSLARVYALRHQQLLESRGHRRFEQIWPVNGEPRWFEVCVRCLVDEHGEPMGVAGYAQDITLHVEQQETARRIQAGLEKRVAQRTRQLSTANEELEAFSYSVSHDLRAPLHAIRGFAELLRDNFEPALGGTGREYLRHIIEGTDRMSGLITDLLQLARVNSGGLSRERTDLGALAHDVLAELAAQAPERRVQCSVAPTPPADCDRGLMRVVLANLLGNAWKFTSRTEAARIEFGSFERDGRPVYFVRDNGAGFDSHNAERIFGAFQRFHREADFPGTGIGLATVKRIIGRHGGQVWAESVPGEGAAFYFTLDTLDC